MEFTAPQLKVVTYKFGVLFSVFRGKNVLASLGIAYFRGSFVLPKVGRCKTILS